MARARRKEGVHFRGEKACRSARKSRNRRRGRRYHRRVSREGGGGSSKEVKKKEGATASSLGKERLNTSATHLKQKKVEEDEADRKERPRVEGRGSRTTHSHLAA